MKKIFGIIAVSAFLFASCGNTANNTEAEQQPTETQTEEVAVSEETTTTECTEATETECTEENAEVAEAPAE